MTTETRGLMTPEAPRRDGRYSATIASSVWSAAVRSAPSWSRCLSPSSARVRLTAAASAAGSSDGTSRAFSPSVNSSRTPRTSVATSGLPADSVSSATSGRPSQRDGRTTVSAVPMMARTSGRSPTRTTRSLTPNSLASSRSSSASGPSPTMIRMAAGTSTRARMASTWFCSTRRPTLRTKGSIVDLPLVREPCSVGWRGR